MSLDRCPRKLARVRTRRVRTAAWLQNRADRLRVSGDVRIGSHLADYRIEATARARGHERCLPGRRPPAATARRAEDPDARAGIRCAFPRAVPARIRARRFDRPPEHHSHLRAGETAGCLFIAMRYVEGTDLKALLREEGALEPVRALAIFAQVADAIDDGTRARSRPPRRQAVERPDRPPRPLLPVRLRPDEEHRGPRGRERERPGRRNGRLCGARNSCGACRSTAEPTSTRSAACSSSASRARCPSHTTPRSR